MKAKGLLPCLQILPLVPILRQMNPELFLSGFLNIILYIFLVSPMHTTWSVHFILHSIIVNCKLYNSVNVTQTQIESEKSVATKLQSNLKTK